jgi:hypothetical protein
MELNDVLYVPGIQANLLSGSQLVNAGAQITIDGDGCTVMDKNGTVVLMLRSMENITL